MNMTLPFVPPFGDLPASAHRPARPQTRQSEVGWLESRRQAVAAALAGRRGATGPSVVDRALAVALGGSADAGDLPPLSC